MFFTVIAAPQSGSGATFLQLVIAKGGDIRLGACNLLSSCFWEAKKSLQELDEMRASLGKISARLFESQVQTSFSEGSLCCAEDLSGNLVVQIPVGSQVLRLTLFLIKDSVLLGRSMELLFLNMLHHQVVLPQTSSSAENTLALSIPPPASDVCSTSQDHVIFHTDRAPSKYREVPNANEGYRPPFVKGSSAGAHQRLFVERVTPSGVVLGPPSPLPDGRTPSADPAPDKSKGTSPSGSAPTVSTTPQRAAHPMGVGGQQILELEPTSSVSRSEPPQEVRRSSLDVEDLGTIRKLRNLNSGRVVFSKVSSQKRRQWLHSDSLGKEEEVENLDGGDSAFTMDTASGVGMSPLPSPIALPSPARAMLRPSITDVRLPVDTCLDILTEIQEEFANNSLHEETISKLDYVRTVLIDNTLYEPELFASKSPGGVSGDGRRASESSSSRRDSSATQEEDEEMAQFVRNELVCKRTPPNNRMNTTLRGFMGAFRFAQKLKSRASKAMNRRLTSAPQEFMLPILEGIHLWEFDMFELANMTGRPLYYTGVSILHKYGLIRRLNLEEDKLKAYLAQLERTYRPNPYHNNIHAADVTQTLFFFLHEGRFDSKLEDIDLFAAIIAACVHDVDHPGFNNNFLIHTSAEQALVYNDISVLENHHCRIAFQMLSQEEYNFLKPLPADLRRQFRDTLISMVLSTDMGKHFDFVGKFQTLRKRGFDPENRSDVILLLQVLLKCSDVSNPAKHLRTYKHWADRVMEEFFQQGDLEKQLGLPVSPFMDRSKPSKPKCQVGFIDYMIKPLYQILGEFEPKLQFAIEIIDRNREYWSEQQAADMAKQASAASKTTSTTISTTTTATTSSPAGLVEKTPAETEASGSH